LKTDNFDLEAYIESGFLDTKKQNKNGATELDDVELSLPSIAEYLSGEIPATQIEPEAPERNGEPKERFRKTVMSAPRPRRSKKKTSIPDIDPALQSVWTALPKNVAFLCSYFDDSVTSNYYRGDFRESRKDLVRRLLDPELSLEETARLLGVCPATVRRYTNREWLTHHRTDGGQRRFRLSDVVRFVDEHGRLPEE
jgi:excisionase family DNA binding protein